MDLSFLAFLAVNDREYQKVEKIRIGDKYVGDKLSAIHVHQTISIPEGFMFLDKETGKGIFRSWHPNGKERHIFELKNWKNNGYYCEMYDNGNIKISGFMIDDKMHGHCYEYYPSGVMKSSLQYNNGELYGCCEYFSEDGILERRDDHLNTYSFERKMFYPTGIISGRYKFLDAKPIDKHNTYYPNGSLSSTIVYSFDHRVILKRAYREKFLTH